MNEQMVKEQADFIFLQSGNVYIVEKDRYGILRLFVAIDEITALACLSSEYKTQIKNVRGEVVMQNFNPIDMKKVVQDLLGDVEQAYDKRLKLLDEIDKALDEGNKQLFMELTEQLRQIDIGGIVDNGVA